MEAIALWPPWAWLLVLVAYFTPAVIAALRGRKPLLVFALTLLLGWTVLGWLAALLLALTGRPDAVRRRRARSGAQADDAAFVGLAASPAFDAFDDGGGGDGGGGGD